MKQLRRSLAKIFLYMGYINLSLKLSLLNYFYFLCFSEAKVIIPCQKANFPTIYQTQHEFINDQCHGSCFF